MVTLDAAGQRYAEDLSEIRIIQMQRDWYGAMERVVGTRMELARGITQQ